MFFLITFLCALATDIVHSLLLAYMDGRIILLLGSEERS